MSKLGRYAADRKKIEEVSAAKTLVQADCGTIFMLASGSADYTISLTTVATAGKGWWCKFVLGFAPSSDTNNVTIAQSTDDTNNIVNVTVVHGPANRLAAHSASFLHTGDGANFDLSFGAIGDTLELFTNATKWYGQAICSSSLSIGQYDA